MLKMILNATTESIVIRVHPRRRPAGPEVLRGASDENLVQALRTVEASLGRPTAEVFASISLKPLAAASLGQVKSQPETDQDVWYAIRQMSGPTNA